MPKIKKIVFVFLVICLILVSFFIGRAYSKFFTVISGQAGADIAYWSFKVNENDDKNQTINLKPTDTSNTIMDNKIAPGTKGEFQIKLDASYSDVCVNYVIIFENETQKPRNLKFEYDGNEYDTLMELQNTLTGTLEAKSQEEIIIIKWFWNYTNGNTIDEIEENDRIDTQDSKNISKYTFDIIVSGTQVNPN